MSQRTIHITNFAGARVAQFDSVDTSVVTGWDLKCMLAEVMGFPTLSFTFASADGRQIDDGISLQGTLGQDACEVEPVPISCVMGMQKSVGPKNSKVQHHPSFSKAGLLLDMEVRHLRAKGKVERLRVPDPDRRAAAEKLLCDSFAPELKELIGVGVDAAYQQASQDDAMSRGQYVFKSADRGVCADLSSCRLWMTIAHGEGFQTRASEMLMKDGLVSTVLWRLLDGWSGTPGGALGGPVRAGPVLEVLFLATASESRQGGEAMNLVAELEEVAGDMGCTAVAVAAVPAQGRRFWKRCGYKVEVPLAEEEERDDASCSSRSPRPGPGPGEPVSALGEFLRERMLLFTDTPLVAKVLQVA